MSNRIKRAQDNLAKRRKAYDTMLTSSKTSPRTKAMHKRPGSTNPRKQA